MEFATNTAGNRGKDRLRSALESAFSMASGRKDDGILKYTLRYIDQNGLSEEHWDIVEPFLKRLIVHFGHTIDYVARILVWRQLTKGDLDVKSWSGILEAVLDKHGRLGNDSEVCWIIYAHQIFEIKIGEGVAERVVRNCGALTLVALLHSANGGLVDQEIFSKAFRRLEDETDNGKCWPVFLEWNLRRWPQHNQVVLTNDTMKELSESEACIYDQTMLPAVFHNVVGEDIARVAFAIEHRSSMYDDEWEDDDVEEEDDDPF